MIGGGCVHQSGRRVALGFVLVEVMVAALLAVFLVGPLATSVQRAVAMARGVRVGAARLSVLGAEGDEAASWAWGPMVQAALWDLGPELRVTVGSPGGGSALVGAWADGWSLGEWEPDGANQLKLVPPLWSGLEGRELILRVREPEGPWGPPWRTIVPDAWCALPGERATEPVDGSAEGGSVVEEGAIVHVPMFSAPFLEDSWTTTPRCGIALGPAFALPPSGPGWCEVELTAKTQSWHARAGRRLDVYF